MSFASVHPRAGIVAAVLAVAVGLVLGGCGDDDEPQQMTAPAVTGASETVDSEKAPGTDTPQDEPSPDPGADEAAIEAALEAVLSEDDTKQSCETLVTDRYVRRAYGDGAGCAAAQAGQKPARRVELSRIVVLPDSVAQAQAEPTGGVYDGQTLRAELVLDQGTWKLDSLRSNVPVGP